jgi:lipopolysaccharide transport system permease protein
MNSSTFVSLPPPDPGAAKRFADVTGDLTNLRAYGSLLRNLVTKQLKLKYRGSFLGLVWSLLNPLSMILVYTLVFSFIMRFPMENYALFLVAGVIHWEFFSSTISASTGAITENRELITKIHFPRIILPVSLVIFDLIQLALAFSAFLLIYLLLGGSFWLGHLLYPLALMLQFLFVLGISAFVSAATVFLRDLQHLIQIVLRLLFWLTPIIYPLASVPDTVIHFIKLNPLTYYINIFQSLLYYRTLPDIASWALALGFALLSFMGGTLFFVLSSPRFSEEV